MSERTTGSGESTLGSERTDRLLITVSSLKEANEIRLKLLRMTPRPWIFVIKVQGKEKWHIRMSNEWGGYPDNEQFEATLEFAKQCASEYVDEDGFIELRQDEIEVLEETNQPVEEIKNPEDIN